MTLTGLQHVLVLSDDIDATRDFYRDVVGLSVGVRPPLEFPGYWLYAGEVPCVHIGERGAYLAHARELGLAVSAQRDGPGPVDHLAFAAADYEEVRARLRREGVDAVANTVPGGPRQLFIDDPNGVRVEINVEQPAR
jgi:catechol 2,3-dioxygenase-like lactoylglutathione lyase family enzyme